MGLQKAKNPIIDNSLDHWKQCDAALQKFTPALSMGFPCEAGDLNRLSSRYRLAKSFESINLTEYAKDTNDGYSSIFRVFLAYSAFEQLLDCCGIKMNSLEAALPGYSSNELMSSIRSIEKYDAYFKAIHAHLDHERHRNQVEAFLEGKACNVLYLPAAVRHIFAHGKLTPNSGAVPPLSVVAISTLLVEFLFVVMNGEFTARLRASGVVV